MPTNIHTSEEFNRQVIQTWVERQGFTGYQAFDFTKLDDLEAYSSGILNLNSGILNLNSGVFAQTTGLNSLVENIDSKIFATGDPAPGGVQGTIVFQADLSSQFDNVDIAGYAGADISGINAAVSSNFPVYNSIELFYDGSSNNTGVFYKSNGITKRIIQMRYNGSSLLTGITKIDL